LNRRIKKIGGAKQVVIFKFKLIAKAKALDSSITTFVALPSTIILKRFSGKIT
jgi:hypothetical protein